MNFNMDPKFQHHFRNVQQIFLYVIDECNLKCSYCLYKPDLVFHLKEREIPLETALALISDFREMGASKLSIMGGEPTLYGLNDHWKPLLTLVVEAKRLGYKYVRIDTNGTFDNALLANDSFSRLDEITFSLDGPTQEINDRVRGKGTFERCVSNIMTAVDLGYNVNVTCCVHRGLVKRGANGALLLDSVIHLVESLGVRRINFHDLLKTGIPRDTWTGKWSPSLKEYYNAYSEISNNINNNRYGIPVRVPQCIVERKEFDANPEYYGYCPAKMGERVLIHPNGMIRICSLLIGTPFAVGRFYRRHILWDDTPTNELRDHEIDRYTPCTNQGKSNLWGDVVPLCVSFKPRQEEIIWNDGLSWEVRKKI